MDHAIREQQILDMFNELSDEDSLHCYLLQYTLYI